MSEKSNVSRQTLRIPKPIRVTAKILEVTSPKLAARFAKKVFSTPVKFKAPKREQKMDENSRQKLIDVAAINKQVMVYHYGDSPKKVLLVHGWCGRGTQLCSIADKILKLGYSTISFDAPAHGKAPGKTSDMGDFIAAIEELDRLYGPFEFAVGHSLGAMSVLNAIKRGVTVKKAVIIGSGDIIKDIMDRFTRQLGMNIATGELMIKLFQKKFNEPLNSFSAYIAAQAVDVPVLVLHDEDDADVPVAASLHIHKHLENGELVVTKGLGHRKILGDTKVIKKIIDFLDNEELTDSTAGPQPDSV